MKKMLSLILAIVMMFALAVGASAEEPSVSTSQDVQEVASGTYGKDVDIVIKNVAGAAAAVYYVTIDWNPLTFTYDYAEEAKEVYNPLTHSSRPVPAGTAGWVNNYTSAYVTVTNHSNVAVDVSASLKDNAVTKTENDVTLTLKKGTGEAYSANAKVTLLSALGKATDGTATDIIAKWTVGVTGTPARVAGFTIDKLTITIVPNVAP